MCTLRWIILTLGVLGGVLGLTATSNAAPLPVSAAAASSIVEGTMTLAGWGPRRWGYRRHWHRPPWGYRWPFYRPWGWRRPYHWGYRRTFYRPWGWHRAY